MKLVSVLDFFILFIIFIKVTFLLSAIANAISSRSHNVKVQLLQPKFKWLKERTEFIFVSSMALLLIIYFRPGSNLQVYGKSRILFFIFGIILMLTANWDLFIKESYWIKLLSGTFGLNR
jgi:hypothetical protein